MADVFWLTKLHLGANLRAYEEFVRRGDYPRVATFPSVHRYRVHRIKGTLTGEPAPAYAQHGLDTVLPPMITGSVAVVIGIALAGSALGMASANWPVAFLTLVVTVCFSVYLPSSGLLRRLPLLLGA